MIVQRLKRLFLLAACTAAAAFVLGLPSLALATPPDPPTDVVSVAGTSSPVIATITWTASADPSVVGYAVYSGFGVNGARGSVEETTGTSSTFIDGLGGFAYYFWVASVNAEGEESVAVQTGPAIATWADSPHSSYATATVSCALCHSTHHSAQGKLLFRPELSRATPSEVCLACHAGNVAGAANIETGETDSFALASGHTLDPSATVSAPVSSCASCHLTHGSSTATRMIPAPKINGASVSSVGPELCLACHDAANSWYGPGYPSVAGPTRNAAGFPVRGTFPGPVTYESSASAHSGIPETTQTAGVQDPIRRSRGDCLYCHAAHRGPNTYAGLEATFTVPSSSTLASDQADGSFASLCFNCHGGVTPSGFATAPVDVKQFVTASGDRAGHRVKTSGGTLPVGSPLPCYECHNPHGSSRGNKSMISDVLGGGLLATDTPQADTTSTAAAVRNFCFTCHTTPTGTGWDSTSTSYVMVESSQTVVGISRTAGVLSLPDFVGHAESDSASCESCHGSDYSAGGNNVHNPGVGVNHVAVNSAECVTCHGDNLNSIHSTTSALKSIAIASFTARSFTAGSTGGCGTCHNNPLYPTLPGTKGFDCLNCHDGSTVGTHAYSPVDPNHYAAPLHTPSDPATFTATYQGGGSKGPIAAGGQECANCHSGELKPAHQHAASGGGSLGCAECHTNTTLQARDVVAGKWTTGRCSECHESGTGVVHNSFAADHVVSAGQCAGTGVSCHNYIDLSQLHSYRQTGGLPKYASCFNADPSDPTGCHNSLDARPIVFDKVNSCGATSSGCHAEKTTTNHGYNASKHTATAASQECVDCHKSFDLGTVHPGGCPTCHAGNYGDIGRTVASAECVDCHNSSRMPGRSWIDTSTATTMGQRMLPHYDANVTTHTVTTWDAGVANTGGFPCSQCHDSVLFSTHSGPTAISLDDSATSFPRNTRCTACHAVADVWGRPSYGKWASQTSGATCSACHPVASDHTQVATKHNASAEIMASPGAGSVTTTATYLFDGFETNNFTAGGWTNSNWQTTNADKLTGTYSARNVSTTSATERYFQKNVDLTASTVAPVLSFAYKTTALSGGTDYLRVYTGTSATGPWTQVFGVTATTSSWTTATVTLPSSNLWLRVASSTNAAAEYVYVDNVTVVTGSATFVSLPASSTAAVSCQNNPNGTDCHDVSDVAALHANTSAKCVTCHVNSSTAPVRNCQTAGCHAGINNTEHYQTGFGTPVHHESQMGSAATFGAGFSAAQCTGCHDDSIANEHTVLSAYSATPCRVCHAKTANSGTPTNVTAADTQATVAKAAGSALCTDCHKTVSASSVHIQRMGTTTTPGSTQFDSTWSGHRAWTSMSGGKTSFGTVSGVNVTNWSLPADASYLKTGWTSSSMVVCSDCHGSITGAVGPHGASMTVNIAAGYDNSYSLGTLYLNGTNMSNTTNLCAKCHTTALGYNTPHSNGKHSGSSPGQCTACHVKTPHSWKRPRLLGYSTDPTPYATRSNALRGIVLQATHTPTNWTESQCSDGGCKGHSVGTSWP